MFSTFCFVLFGGHSKGCSAFSFHVVEGNMCLIWGVKSRLSTWKACVQLSIWFFHFLFVFKQLVSLSKLLDAHPHSRINNNYHIDLGNMIQFINIINAQQLFAGFLNYSVWHKTDVFKCRHMYFLPQTYAYLGGCHIRLWSGVTSGCDRDISMLRSYVWWCFGDSVVLWIKF